jgi:hypothetical protein
MATLVPCLVALRAEFNRNFPARDKTSDGWIGDTAHQQGTSDHNPDGRGLVHAIDVDKDLRAPGATMQDCVDEVVRRHRAGTDNRLTYVIFNRRIWSASRGWAVRDYTGENPHDKHAHFSAGSVPARENNRASFGVEDIMTQADRDDIVRRTTAAVVAALTTRGEQSDGTVTSAIGRNAFDQGIPPANGVLPRWPAWRVISDTRTQVLELEAKVDALLKASGTTVVPEQR